MIVTLSFTKSKFYSYDWYKTKERKRKNAFKRFEAKLKENAFTSYWRINIREIKMLSTNFCYGGEEIYEIENLKN